MGKHAETEPALERLNMLIYTDQLAEVDAFAEALRKKRPHERVTRTDAVRILIARGLADAQRSR